MQTVQQGAAYQGVPEVVRVKALKGFRGLIDGSIGIANPGDVVDVPRDLAISVRFGGKGVMVDPSTEKVRQQNYLPERKKNKPLDPQVAQVAALVDAVNSMQAAIATQGKAIEALLSAKK